jgi:hypothetical protein
MRCCEREARGGVRRCLVCGSGWWNRPSVGWDDCLPQSSVEEARGASLDGASPPSDVSHRCNQVFGCWWLVWLDNTSKQGVSSTPRCLWVANALIFHQWSGICAVGSNIEFEGSQGLVCICVSIGPYVKILNGSLSVLCFNTCMCIYTLSLLIWIQVTYAYGCTCLKKIIRIHFVHSCFGAKIHKNNKTPVHVIMIVVLSAHNSLYVYMLLWTEYHITPSFISKENLRGNPIWFTKQIFLVEEVYWAKIFFLRISLPSKWTTRNYNHSN